MISFLTTDLGKHYIKKVAPNMSQEKIALLSGGFAGMACLTIAVPTETLKARAQISESSNFNYTQEIKKIMKTRGIRGFYTGLPAQA